MAEKPLSLYVHIPFCVRKCAYCDFLSGPAPEEVKEKYVKLLCEEIEQKAACYRGYQVNTVFFGGGTPTVLKAGQLETILCKLKECFLIKLPGKITEEKEITLECNPGTVDEESLRKLRKTGFNRLSIGLQSAKDEELEKLGRIHTWRDFLGTYHAARKAGFGNINVDIMSALPGQSVESYADTLREVTALCPEHISAYSLIIEEGTPFYERYGEADRERQKEGEDRGHLLPTEEEERQMYELTEEMLGRKGYHRYEISNYALPGYECCHNIIYWKRGNYLGLGPGAASLVENCRFANPRDLNEYEKMIRGGMENTESSDLMPAAERKGDQESERLSIQEQMEEFMFLGLRLINGISCGEFQENFQVPIESIYGEVLKKLKKQGFLEWKEDRIFLTKRGIDVSNVVLAEFLLSS